MTQINLKTQEQIDLESQGYVVIAETCLDSSMKLYIHKTDIVALPASEIQGRADAWIRGLIYAHL